MMVLKPRLAQLGSALACAAVIAALPATSRISFAQAPTPPAPAPKAQPEKPAAQPEKPQTPPRPPREPTLDELLGLPGSGADAGDPSRSELDRLLTGAEMGEAFKQAAALMSDAAKRLQDHGDAGLGTQRVQEDALRRLDQLISSLENQQQQGSPSPSQATSQQQSVPSQTRQQAQPTDGDNQGQVDPPGRQDGPLRPPLEAARAAWGNLPERVRDMLIQGSSDRFSSLYKSLTEEYYRRLAEEGSRR